VLLSVSVSVSLSLSLSLEGYVPSELDGKEAIRRCE
jgi:hypothetical protein